MVTEFKKCCYGKYHQKGYGCIHVDTTSNARFIHRYLARIETTILDYWTQTPIKKKTFYQVQWKNILIDLKNTFRIHLEWKLRYALALVFLFISIKSKLKIPPFFIGAIAVDNTSNVSQNPNAGTTLTLSHTVNSNTNGVIAAVTPFLARNGQQVTGETYNSVALTKITGATTSDAAGRELNIWYLKAPSTGANNLVATWNGAALNGSFESSGLSIISLTGVDQTTPVDSSNNGVAAATTTPSLAVTIVNNNAYMVGGCFTDYNPSNFTETGTNQTRIHAQVAGNPTYTGGESYAGPRNSGSQSMSWSVTTDTHDWHIGIAVFKPVAAANTGNFLLFM